MQFQGRFCASGKGSGLFMVYETPEGGNKEVLGMLNNLNLIGLWTKVLD